MCSRVKIDDHAVKMWGKSNAKFIKTRYPKVREHGFIIITAIHVAKACELNCWSKERASYTGNVGIGAFGNAIMPQLGGEFRQAEASMGWVTRPTDDDKALVPISP